MVALFRLTFLNCLECLTALIATVHFSACQLHELVLICIFDKGNRVTSQFQDRRQQLDGEIVIR